MKEIGDCNRKVGKRYKQANHLKGSPLANNCRNQRNALELELLIATTRTYIP